MKFAVIARLFYQPHATETMDETWRKILEAFKIAKNSTDRPWELQDKLRKILPSVVSVGDDLSFTVKLNKEVEVNEDKILSLGAKRTRIYPFKNAYRFEKGYVAIEGKFIRISREIDEGLLRKILEALS